VKTESTSSKWRAGPGGKGDRSRPCDKEKFDEGWKAAYGDRPCPIESRDLSWLEEEQANDQ